MPSQRFIRLAPWLAAAALSLLAHGAHALDSVTLSPTPTDDTLSGMYAANFTSEISQIGFTFTLTEGFAYTIELEVDGTFKAQSGLTGYAIQVGFDKDASWGLLSAKTTPETYHLSLSNVSGGEHVISLSALNFGSGGSTRLNLSALRQPVTPTPLLPSAPVPEPETYAMMLAGLGTLAWMARRKRQAV